jgi:hypothetical protein
MNDLVDRLLSSPRYGERWARHWLDIAGYADSDGYTNDDTPRPHAYKYRDYVIRALNERQTLRPVPHRTIAGDELALARHATVEGPRFRIPQSREWLVATGFLRMAADGTATGGIDQDVARNQVVADTLKIVSTSLLGLTVGCAQCHDHRYDPSHRPITTDSGRSSNRPTTGRIGARPTNAGSRSTPSPTARQAQRPSKPKPANSVPKKGSQADSLSRRSPEESTSRNWNVRLAGGALGRVQHRADKDRTEEQKQTPQGKPQRQHQPRRSLPVQPQGRRGL